MSPIPELSQELIDNIIDHVAASSLDSDYLRQCALASRSFRPRSQLHTFSSIVIKGDLEKREERIDNLFAIIQHNPHIADYIEDLNLDCTDFEYSWIIDNPTFIAVMEKISTSARPLRKLALRADTDGSCETMTFEDPQSLLDLFFIPFITLSITSLTLDRLKNVPIDTVASCINLKNLELMFVEFTECSERSAQPHRLQLQRLAHRRSRPALKKLLDPSSLDLSQLKSFTVYTDELDHLEFENEIINATCGSLEEVYLISLETAWSAIFRDSLNLQDSPRLRLLHAHALFPEDKLVYISRTLSTIRSRSLENFFIDAKVGFRDTNPTLDILFDADWTTFCSQVARVMSDKPGSTFDLKITYLYFKYNVNKKLDKLLEERCQSVINRLRTEKLGSLMDSNPGIVISLRYDLEFDVLYHD